MDIGSAAVLVVVILMVFVGGGYVLHETKQDRHRIVGKVDAEVKRLDLDRLESNARVTAMQNEITQLREYLLSRGPRVSS